MFVCSQTYILLLPSTNMGEPCGRQVWGTKYAEKIPFFGGRGACVSAKSVPSCDSPHMCLSQYSTHVDTSGQEKRKAVLCLLKLSLPFNIFLQSKKKKFRSRVLPLLWLGSKIKSLVTLSRSQRRSADTTPEACLLGLHCPDRETLFKIALKKFSMTYFSEYIIAHYLWHFNHFWKYCLEL